MDAARLLADERRLKEHLRATEALAAYSDNVAVGKLVRFFVVRALTGGLHLGIKVQGDVESVESIGFKSTLKET